ncbi:hypothetical protein EV13_0007 [Prochlorococcus sp. MIT 0702]|nr:hypothetical protein EV12_0755 [Prochlorococcus sp. MIT 0701]KGG31035.1 hypothetical protein EV13_0007 [Prochlorococcus sp. MIT 0702]KGG35848.1 hypothetical protein EV14_0640 [Prochlorococcus sp. MIT 0703]
MGMVLNYILLTCISWPFVALIAGWCCQPLFPNNKAFDLQRNSGRTTFATRSLIISAVLSAIACFIDLPLISQPPTLGL